MVFDDEFDFPLNPSKLIFDAANMLLIMGMMIRDMRLLYFCKHGLFDCFKLNIDGANDRSDKIGAGGVLRHHGGSWINGFTASLDCETVIQAGKLKPGGFSRV